MPDQFIELKNKENIQVLINKDHIVFIEQIGLESHLKLTSGDLIKVDLTIDQIAARIKGMQQ